MPAITELDPNLIRALASSGAATSIPDALDTIIAKINEVISDLGGGAIAGSGTSGTLAKFTGSETIGDSPVVDTGSAVDLTRSLSFFGGTGANQGAVYFNSGAINSWLQTNAAATLQLNQTGYGAGTTQFRNLEIRDGKDAVIATFTGSSKQVDFAGAITVAGSATLGNAAADVIGFYGAAGTAQQTGVAVTAAAIHAALVNLGLITA